MLELRFEYLLLPRLQSWFMLTPGGVAGRLRREKTMCYYFDSGKPARAPADNEGC